MASRTFMDVQTLNNQLKVIAGSFAPAGTGAVTAPKGKGFTVARSGVGAFLVTLTDKYYDLVASQSNVQLNAAAGTTTTVGAYNPTAGTIAISTVDASGAPVDIAANANNRINFVLWLRNSDVP